jgi:hypothetical protein
MFPLTIGDALISGLILGYGHKLGSQLGNVQDMTKALLDNLPDVIKVSQEAQEKLIALRYRPRLYEKLTIDLSTARSKEKYDITGTYIIAQTIDGELEIRFNEQDADPVTVNGDNRIFNVDFDTLYITNTAQSGKSVTFLIGKAGAFVGSTITPMTLNAQSVGVYLQPDWASKEGNAKFLEAGDSLLGYGGTVTCEYTVPVGKVLYVTNLSGACFASNEADGDKNQHFIGWITIDAMTAGDIGGNGGFAVPFTTPLKATAGQVAKGWISSAANHLVDLWINIVAFEVDA